MEEDTKIQEEKHTKILNKINDAFSMLDEIDNYFIEEAPNIESTTDQKIQDILHQIEFLTDEDMENLKPTACKKIIRELREQRQLRRKVKNDIEIKKVYYEEYRKLNSRENRSFLRESLFKKEKQLDSRIYSPRNYNDEEIEKFFPINKGKEPIEISDDDVVKELLSDVN